VLTGGWATLPADEVGIVVAEERVEPTLVVFCSRCTCDDVRLRRELSLERAIVAIGQQSGRRPECASWPGCQLGGDCSQSVVEVVDRDDLVGQSQLVGFVGVDWLVPEDDFLGGPEADQSRQEERCTAVTGQPDPRIRKFERRVLAEDEQVRKQREAKPRFQLRYR